MIRDALAVVLVVCGAVWLAQQRAPAASGGGTLFLPDGWAGDAAGEPIEPDQGTTIFEDVIVSLTPSTYAPAAVTPDVASRNQKAFLDMIAFAEGTAGRGDDGYNILFGGAEFDGYARHPRVYVPFGNTTSSAAGRYQFLARTWDGLAAKLGLPDFGPASQDAGALELIRERGALADVQAGRTVRAINKVARVWASLPGAGYGQPERRLSALLNAYAQAGGISEVTTA
ncbi:hypothetical protein AVHY2522_22940 [Acidovorax sp. SUPP2522]|uniref:glycoside hydrolase family 24 protein n=1 Tax=unclassified Acidovorax TaxID=2684926 RepID=UPI0023DE5B69|nr:hypothetical protein AVHY2522_22940 [Acidovorax sp. SUPP2522]